MPVGQRKIKGLFLLSVLREYRTLSRSLVTLGLVASAYVLGLTLPVTVGSQPQIAAKRLPSGFNRQLRQVEVRLARVEQAQRARGIRTLAPVNLAGVKATARAGQLSTATAAVRQIDNQLTQAEQKLSNLGQAVHAIQVPILMYHKTPADFEQQLVALRDKGYTTITLDELAGAFYTGYPLPAKPVIITYDDGFADQMIAFDLLRKYSMKATYYIINGGERSQYCIGSNRHDGAPCGDAYLSWEQVRQLDRSGIITIAAHTVDHANLAAVSAEERQFEMTQSKAEIEAQIGHRVHHLAYPYGAFNDDVIATARAAGFVTAVSTLPGIEQTINDLYALKRVRDAYSLP